MREIQDTHPCTQVQREKKQIWKKMFLKRIHFKNNTLANKGPSGNIEEESQLQSIKVEENSWTGNYFDYSEIEE